MTQRQVPPTILQPNSGHPELACTSVEATDGNVVLPDRRAPLQVMDPKTPCNFFLGIQSPKLRKIMDAKYFAFRRSFLHPNRPPDVRWLDPYGACFLSSNSPSLWPSMLLVSRPAKVPAYLFSLLWECQSLEMYNTHVYITNNIHYSTIRFNSVAPYIHHSRLSGTTEMCAKYNLAFVNGQYLNLCRTNHVWTVKPKPEAEWINNKFWHSKPSWHGFHVYLTQLKLKHIRSKSGWLWMTAIRNLEPTHHGHVVIEKLTGYDTLIHARLPK